MWVYWWTTCVITSRQSWEPPSVTRSPFPDGARTAKSRLHPRQRISPTKRTARLFADHDRRIRSSDVGQLLRRQFSLASRVVFNLAVRELRLDGRCREGPAVRMSELEDSGSQFRSWFWGRLASGHASCSGRTCRREESRRMCKQLVSLPRRTSPAKTDPPLALCLPKVARPRHAAHVASAAGPGMDRDQSKAQKGLARVHDHVRESPQ